MTMMYFRASRVSAGLQGAGLLLVLFVICLIAGTAVAPKQSDELVAGEKENDSPREPEAAEATGADQGDTSTEVAKHREKRWGFIRRAVRRVSRTISRTVRRITRSVSRVVRRVSRTVSRTARTAWTAVRRVSSYARRGIGSFVRSVGSGIRAGVTWLSNTAASIVNGIGRLIRVPYCGISRLFTTRSRRISSRYYTRRICTNYRPAFGYCPRYLNPYTYTPDTGSDTARVTWDDARIRSNARGSGLRIYTSGGQSGDSFSIRRHTIRYTAVDIRNNRAYCYFYFRVNAPQSCPTPAIPQNGLSVTNPGSTSYERSRHQVFSGQRVVFTCQQGYSVVGNPELYCRDGHQWSGDPPTCERNECDAPAVPNHVQLVFCDNVFTFNSVCTFTCEELYSPAEPSVAQVRCTDTGQWSAELTPCRDATPPVISCPESITAYTGRLEAGVTVTWETPTAQDILGAAEVTLTDGQAPGSFFAIANGAYIYPITYTASDSSGNEATCIFDVIIEDVPCEGLQTNYTMEVVCTHENSYGSECTFTCAATYELHGGASATCERDGNTPPQAYWDYSGANTPQCMRVTCDEPAVPDHVVLLSCSDGFTYDSVCEYGCAEHYSPAEASLDYIRCNASGQWHAQLTDCRDATPPEVTSCPDSIRAYTGWRMNGAVVSWEQPTAEDALSSVIIAQTEGQVSGSYFSIDQGTYVYSVNYNVSDTAGNEAPPCTFDVIIEDAPCMAISTEEGLSKDCTHSNSYGSNCSFSCGVLSLTGADWAVCQRNDSDPPQAYWDYSENDPPRCESEGCDDLAAPVNGAVACSNWLHGRRCTMSCATGFTPTATPNNEYTGLSVCDVVSQEWDMTFPDCEPETPFSQSQIATEFYYDGECDNNVQIRQRLIDMLSASQYSAFCTQYPECTIGNVEVTCWESTDRRKRSGTWRGFPAMDKHHRTKRSTDRVFIKMWLLLDLDLFPGLEGDALFDAVNSQFLSILTTFYYDMVDGDYDMDGLVADYTTFFFGWPQPNCDPGSVPANSGFQCTLCSSGTSLSSGSDACEYCAEGTYQDEAGQTVCMQCPEGTSTLRPGARNSSQCFDVCPAGQYSHNGFMPCAPCARNSYQNVTGRTECVPCSEGLVTTGQGSTSHHQCYSVEFGPCSRDPCSNGARCLQRENNYTCHCTPGYYGSHCQNFTDPCLNEPCANGGTCDAQGPYNITCECPDNTNGNRCEVLVEDGCPSGTMMESSEWWIRDDVFVCTPCAVGSYQDEPNQSICTQCPEGTSTLGTGARYSTQCLTVCPSGKYSTTGLMPCIPCARNFFQNATGHTECITCPEGLVTTGPGSSSINQCYSTEFGPCSQMPCINGGSCTQRENNYTCTCQPGYHGVHCQNFTDPCSMGPCENNGTCLAEGPNAFNCSCPQQTNGTLCEVLIVDGGWSAWAWTDCSVSCNNGTRSRTRDCTNPVPVNGGMPCEGIDEETEICNSHECPTCRELQPPANGWLNCTENEQNDTECEVHCEDNFSLSSSETANVTCGPSYDYEWDFDNETQSLPTCIENQAPSQVKLKQTVTIPVSPDISSDDHDSLNEQAREYVSSKVGCVGSGTCSVSVDTGGDARRRRRYAQSDYSSHLRLRPRRQSDAQSDDSGLDVTITITMETGGGTVDNATDDALNNAWSDIGDFVESFSDDLTNGTLSLSVNNVSYSISPDSLSMGVDLTCDDPLVAFDGMCVNCPAGSHKHEGSCRQCPLGQYQPDEGQMSCEQCPEGFTTTYSGAIALSLCVEMQQEVCPPGTFNDDGQCTACPPGHYSYTEGATNCSECAVATYQELPGQTSCFECDEDEVTESTGSTSAADCFIDESLCPSGTFTTDDGCTLCPIGYYSSLPGQDSCDQCAANQTTESFGAASEEECDFIERECPAGTYGDGITCEPCAVGEYQDEEGQTACISCGNGFTTLEDESTSLDDCLQIQDSCEAGYYAFGGTCGICPYGYYQPEPDQPLCMTCEYGFTTTREGATNASYCVPPDSVTDECEEGHYLEDEVCTLCPVGQYQPDTDQASCMPCAEGYTTEGRGSTDQSDCMLDSDENASAEESAEPNEEPDDSGNSGNSDRHTSKKKSSSDDSALLMIIPIVISMAALIIVVVLATVFFCKKKSRRVVHSRPVTARSLCSPTAVSAYFLEDPPPYVRELEQFEAKQSNQAASAPPTQATYVPRKKQTLPPIAD